ncbi:hypothetical protein B0H10DRAFT_2217182 [Mycena sp. CBHHK59/15]|nr:hypothetical protein B0H10DRAFT_2217182 [Mycena sp. CBHHK59/15]
MATRALCPSPSWRPAHSRVKTIHRGGVIFSMRAPRAPQSIVELSGSVFDHKPSAAFADNNSSLSILHSHPDVQSLNCDPLPVPAPLFDWTRTRSPLPLPRLAPVYIFPSPKA